MLGIDQVNSNPYSVAAALRTIEEDLSTMTTVPALESNRVATLHMLRDNLQRIAGQTPKGAVRGYHGHPDYAEVGRIRSNYQLLDSLRETQPPREPAAATNTLPW